MPKKGKGKGKKGKKGGKKGGKKSNKDETIKSMADANSVLWQSRLEIVERSRYEHREHARALALENEALQNQVVQTEKDTIDVVSYLKNQDDDKDKQIDRLINQMQEMQREHSKEKEKIVSEFQSQIDKLVCKLATRTREVELIQAELKLVKDFRRKRAQMQRELEEIKETMFSANQEHKDTLKELEDKFFEEKMKLQQEASAKISELAEKAHAEAIANLDEATKSVYKENVRITKALNYHTEEGEQLRKLKERLERENDQLKGDKEIDDLLIQRKVAQARHNKRLVKELQERVSTLEKSLTHVVGQFELEQQALVEKTMVETESARIEITKLQRMVELKSKEMNKVKKLARNILDQRTEVERFFLESLEEVKKEIVANRLQYRKDAEFAYQQKMLDAYLGKVDFPKIRTFNKADNSTNSVFHDLEAAEHMMDFSDKVDISDLTWEQKEKVLRYLFARMNKTTKVSSRPSPPQTQPSTQPAILNGPDESIPSLMDKEAWPEKEDLNEISNPAFLTQANVNGLSSSPELPHIGNTPLVSSPVG